MESSWFPVMDISAQQQLRSAVAGKGFHFWWKRCLVWLSRTTGMAGLCHFDQSLGNSLPKQLPLLIWKSACVVQEQQAQGHIQGKGHCRALIPFPEKELFLEMLTARTWIQCFSVYKKEGDRFPVFFLLFLSELWWQTTMLIPELGVERGQGTGGTGGHSCTTGLSMGISTGSLADQGTWLGKCSSLYLTCNCLYFVIYLA